MSIIRRGSTFHLVRSVPKRYRPVESRAQVWISLATDSPDIATRKAAEAWARMLEAWEARLAGNTDDAEAQFAAARNIAAAKGFRFLPMESVVKLPIDEIVARVLAAHDAKGRPNMQDAQALLGAAKQPPITVSRALEIYWQVAADKVLRKSPDQERRWRNPKRKAIRNFVDVVGDIPISQITPEDMQTFRDWWLEKIATEDLTENSANKDLTHVATVLRTVIRAKRLGLDLPLGGWRIAEGDERTRPPFSTEWLRDRILAPGALAGLNTQARVIVLAMVNTGCRPSEIACMTRAQILLDAPVPHVSVEPVGRTLKSQYAKRKIPLVGVSLDAMKECPDGFPRYADKPGLANLVNKYLAANGLKEGPGTTLYSIRHSFQDRMIAAGIDDRTRRDLFGHALTEERYGHGASLEQKREMLMRLAL